MERGFANASEAEAVQVPHVPSPAKRSLHSALMAVSPGGTERLVTDNQRPAVAGANRSASQQTVVSIE